jgi:hypothetical protein
MALWAGINSAPTNTTPVLGVGAEFIPARSSAEQVNPAFSDKLLGRNLHGVTPTHSTVSSV